MMELINAPGWARNVYPVTYLSGNTQDCADLHSFGPGMREIYILHYVLRGRGVFEENGRAYPVETGGTFLVRPQAIIRYAPDPADPWEYIWVDFCGSEAAALLRQTGFSSRSPVAPPLPREEMEPLYRRILAAGDGHKEYHQARATGYLHVLLSTYMEKFPPDRPMDDGYGYVQSALQFITTRYHRPLSVEDIAAHLGISRTHLYRLFHRFLAVSPNEYLARFRVQSACAMLSSSNLSVKSIAHAVGYEDQLYFSKVFRRLTGETPTGYRQSHPPAE